MYHKRDGSIKTRGEFSGEGRDLRTLFSRGVICKEVVGLTEV